MLTFMEVTMHKTDVLEFFKGTSKTAIALGVSHSAVCQWGHIIPEKQALKAEKITDGKLRYDPSDYQKPTAPAA